MFTGIIEEVGRIRSIRSQGRFAIDARHVVSDVRLGDSIAVNGVCLTVVAFDSRGFEVDVVPETLRRSTLGELTHGSTVNLERAMAVGDRFGGHIVAGHVDCVGTITAITTDKNAHVITVASNPDTLQYIVEKGSITIDGISLTVMDVSAEAFSVSIIPHTGMITTLGEKRIGDRVNLEVDMIGKYVEKWVTAFLQRGVSPSSRSSKGVTEAYLKEHGFL